MPRVPKCLSCQQDMKLVPGTTVKRKSRTGCSTYCSRTYKCDLCDVSEVVNGTGMYDIDNNPVEIEKTKNTFIEDKSYCEEVILSAFGVPKSLFGKQIINKSLLLLNSYYL